MKKIVLAILGLSLAACATEPLQLCLREANSEYRAAWDARDEVVGNISRGYAIHTQRVPYQYSSLCYDSYTMSNYSCMQTGSRNQDTPVSINIQEERNKLRYIDSVLGTLEQEALAARRVCHATYPAGDI